MTKYFSVYFVFILILGTILNSLNSKFGTVNHFYMFNPKVAVQYLPFAGFVNAVHWEFNGFEVYPILVITIFVLFITSDNTPKAWGAMTEIGASWITQIDNKIFNIPPFKPQHPLNDEVLWHSTNRSEENGLSMNSLNVDIFCQKIEHVCDVLGYDKRERSSDKAYLKTLVKEENE